MVVGCPPDSTKTRCQKCGVGFSLTVEEGETFACVYCGWRQYGQRDTSRSKRSNIEGRIIRVRYVGPRLAWRQWYPLVAVMVEKRFSTRSTRLGLLIHCPLCAAEGKSFAMDASDSTERRWICPEVGHSIELHLGHSRELVGWS